MLVDCVYFGNGEFYGLDICHDDRDPWEYHSDRYIDFVIDCLNENFYSIAAGCFPIVSAESSDPTTLNKLAVEAIREEYKSRPYAAEGLAQYWEESLPDTLKNYEMVTAFSVVNTVVDILHLHAKVSNIAICPVQSIPQKIVRST